MKLRPMVFAALMAGAAAVLQTAPVWWGEPFGLALAATASLPIAIAALAAPKEACLGYLATVALCLVIHVEEALVFGIANGPYGIALGVALHGGRPRYQAVPLVAAVLTAGMFLLSLTMPALGPEVGAMSTGLALLLYCGFALVWSWLGVWVVWGLRQRLGPLLERMGSNGNG